MCYQIHTLVVVVVMIIATLNSLINCFMSIFRLYHVIKNIELKIFIIIHGRVALPTPPPPVLHSTLTPPAHHEN